MIRAFAKIEKGWDFKSIHIGQAKVIVEHNETSVTVKETKDTRSVTVTPRPIHGAQASAVTPTVIINGVVQTPSERPLHDYYLNPAKSQTIEYMMCFLISR